MAVIGDYWAIMTGASETVRCGDSDFALAFYIVHEVPNKQLLFDEIISIINPDGKVLMVDPVFHVSKKAFEETVKKAQTAGFVPVERPKMFFSQTVIMQVA